MLIELSCTHNYPPVQKSPGDVGADLRLSQTVTLKPREVTRIETGVCVEHIAPGFWLKLETKSGAANRGLIVVGGVIDNAYRGQIGVLVLNTNKHQVVLNPGEAVAQLIIMAHFEPAEQISVEGELLGVVQQASRGKDGGLWR